MTYKKPPVIVGPFGGIIDNVPPTSNSAPPNSFSSVAGWMLRKGRMHSFPLLSAITNPPNGEPVLGAKSFLDVLGNYHTLVLTQDNGYFLNADGSYNLLTGLPPLNTPAFVNSQPFPYAIEFFQNDLFFANGGQQVSYVTGGQNWQIAGDVPGSCFFMGKLDSHLIQAFCIEPISSINGSQVFPQRVRWSASGNPFEWNTNIDVTAGENDIPDIEDQITGFNVLGPYGFVYRPSGITVMSPTGYGLAPFSFENFSIGPRGVGVYFIYTLATYGYMSAFVALNDIYTFSGSTPQAIGGSSKKTIFADLNARTGFPQAFMLGDLTQGLDYLSYWLCIPLANDQTRIYIYNFDENNWSSFTEAGHGVLTTLGDVVLT